MARTVEVAERLRGLVRDVPDFPKPGIVFKDITPLLADAAALRDVGAAMAEPFRGASIDQVIGIESRGFILGALVARELGCGFVPVRKPGKLPADVRRVEYSLEYGKDALEVHVDAFEKGQRVLVVDDVLATGGTARATCELMEALGGRVEGLSFLMVLGFLKGEGALAGRRLATVLRY
jgi:adenine phosphoribosyltransferase